MSTYELDDEVVRVFVANYRERFEADRANATEPMLAELLGKQIPIPVPNLPGAVVRTEDGTIWVAAPCGNHWLHEADSFQNGQDHRGIRDFIHRDHLPRIVAVLSEGVDV